MVLVDLFVQNNTKVEILDVKLNFWTRDKKINSETSRKSCYALVPVDLQFLPRVNCWQEHKLLLEQPLLFILLPRKAHIMINEKTMRKGIKMRSTTA